ncbi:MAG: hypothetical protein EDM79_11105, partial [Chloroflexi bacterium]
MKNLVRFTILFALLFGPSACGPRETWVYLVMGVMTREETSDIPEQFASYIEQEAGVKVVIHEQERWEP